MKITGIVLIAIGLIAGAISLVPMVQPSAPNSDAPTDASHQAGAADKVSILPLALCGVAVVAGGLMFMFGGKGYFVSNDPRVRN